MTEIAAGRTHTCALLDDGSVYCWGTAGQGALGIPGRTEIGLEVSPSDVGPVDLGGPAVALRSSFFNTCAILEGGDVICWGEESMLGQPEHSGMLG